MKVCCNVIKIKVYFASIQRVPNHNRYHISFIILRHLTIKLGESMTFTPVTRMANSIPRALLEFSKDRSIDVKLIDFELISFETLLKRDDEKEYTIIEDGNRISKEDFLNDRVTLIQEYRIKIMPLQKEKLYPSIKLSIATNKLKTKAVITIQKKSLFIRDDNLFDKLKHQIWEKKLRSGLFIDMFEPQLDQYLKKILKGVPYGRPLSKELKFSVALGYEPLSPVDAVLEKIYEQKEEHSKSMIDGVNKDELILKYTKLKDGKDGRSCNGQYIPVRKALEINQKPVVDATIRLQEYPDRIEYFANENGYVAWEKGIYTISKKLTLNGANFKSTGNIDSGAGDKDISVHVKHKKSHGEDAIGSGVCIDVKELSVDGSVGSNVKIATQELHVDAQTHKKSKLEVANSANVKLHRGDLVATDAQIDMLESGKVKAKKTIHIKKMLGGEAIAPIVRVDELLSNSVIIASELIEIQSLNGTNNTLKIDPEKIESYHNDLLELKENIKNKKSKHRVEAETLHKKLQEHSSSVDRLKTFQKRVQAALKAGKQPMKQDILRIKLFKNESQKLKEETDKLGLFGKEIEKLELELDKMLNKDLHAKIISHTAYDGHTKIIFVNIKTQEEIVHIPEGSVHTISLMLNHDGERVVKSV